MYTFNRIKVNPQLPKRIEKLSEIANNLWWSWNTNFLRIFKEIDIDLWERVEKYPVKFLKNVSQEKLIEACENQELLKEYNPLLCTGYQSIEEIEENKKQFYSNNDNKILIATWQKFGVGHTVVSANYVIFVDTPWNNADFEQAVDRIYRIGQQKTVFITTLISKNTYDERVQQLLDNSKKLSNQIIDNIIDDD